MNDFLKKAYSNGKVKNLDEAFKEFPAEEEWHKGDALGLIGESNIEYLSKYSIGDIVFVKEFLFPNGSIGKDHLFVIIDQDNTVIPIENFGMLISSKLKKIGYSSNVLLKSDLINNLNCDSLVKTDCIYKISNKDILFKIGKVDEENIFRYKKMFLK